MRANVDAAIYADPLDGLPVPRDDRVPFDEVEGLFTNARVRRNEQGRRPDRSVELHGHARIRTDGAVNSEFRAGSDNVKGEVARGRRNPEVSRGRVFQVHPQHHERWRVRFDAPLHAQADAARGVSRQPPGH